MRARILQLLRQNEDGYLSGEAISEKLAISRTAVWKHIRALKEAGYQIEAHPRCGYSLQQAPDKLLPEEIYSRLNASTLGKKIHYFSKVTSTNTEAKKLAESGCQEGTVVLAEEQENGRGRISRGWFSPPGQGIWLSVVLRPALSPYEISKCTLMAAVAVYKAILRVTGIKCGIKWPNDILYQGKKLVGILTELNAEVDAVNYIVIGIGINVNIAAEDFPSEIKSIATSLAVAAGESVSRLELVCAVLEELEKSYQAVLQQGFGEVLTEWRSYSATLGKEVSVIGANESYVGKALDIAEDGALLVQVADKIERVVAGDISIRTI
ncbi:MAG: biotin--[acetyl-CoA-carboxylase] ligase [Pelosinus sp.]|nr:biotin--[acetyl-CoA-carboxylase] ligase [Pelosinus sp.]